MKEILRKFINWLVKWKNKIKGWFTKADKKVDSFIDMIETFEKEHSK